MSLDQVLSWRAHGAELGQSPLQSRHNLSWWTRTSQKQARTISMYGVSVAHARYSPSYEKESELIDVLEGGSQSSEPY